LVFTGYKLVNPKMIKSLYQLGRGEIFIYLITVVTIVTTDLLTGVVVGITAAGLKLFYVFSRLDVSVEYQPNGDRTVLHLTGAATFVSLPRMAAVLEAIPQTTELHVDFNKLDYIDHACLDLLAAWEKQHAVTGGRLIIDWEDLTTKFHRGLTKKASSST
jgi:MFS superfamily sulfate permease-like transporter